MAYLRWRAMDGEGGTAHKISEIIGQSNVLLEALGNAKTTNKYDRPSNPRRGRLWLAEHAAPPHRTHASHLRAAHTPRASEPIPSRLCASPPRSNNSSRFGKYLELAFAPDSHAICGAKFKTFLLEKSRVAHQVPKWSGASAPATLTLAELTLSSP